jgi:hypothetical protein
MGLVAVEAPTLQLSTLFYTACREVGPILAAVGTARQVLQVIAHGLVQAFAHALGSQAGFFNGLGVCGQGDVHKIYTGYVQKI